MEGNPIKCLSIIIAMENNACSGKTDGNLNITAGLCWCSI